MSENFKTIGAKLKELERFDFLYQGFILIVNFKRVYLKTTFYGNISKCFLNVT